ncbi:hypothetical protein QFC21_005566 [Naganishia friedmannii]|uniref:Uncharacterized protein n=1 Tax=Naganishia friedmannii TaxID=89922 RepID=A0ACC2V8K4_9TREE|nr:hypothetical protein QFC21_005566 [Naganishia friedmannii]
MHINSINSQSRSVGLISLILLLQASPALVYGAALVSRDEKVSEFAYYNVDNFPDYIRKALIPENEGKCNVVVQAQDFLFFGTQVYAFPACHLSAEKMKNRASVSWPQPEPQGRLEFQTDWGNTFYIVQGISNSDNAEATPGHLVSRAIWDPNTKILSPPAFLSEKDWTYSTATYEGGKQDVQTHSLLGPWLNPYTHVIGETVCEERPLNTSCLDDVSRRAYVRPI